MNNYLIYKHTSPSGKSYIGQTNNYNRRCSKHKNNTGCRAFHSAIKHYGWDNFKHEILHENLTIDQANELEAKCILEHNTLSPNGYNLATGGLNSKPSQETRAKISLANKNRSQETRDKISLSNKGKTRSKETRAKMSLAKKNQSQETRDKISLSNKGKTRSKETRAKMSLANKGKTLSQEIRDKMSLTRKANTFEKLKQQYLQITLTKSNYSANNLAELLFSNYCTIFNHLNPTTRNNLGYYIIPVQQIHDYFNQPNPYMLT